MKAAPRRAALAFKAWAFGACAFGASAFGASAFGAALMDAARRRPAPGGTARPSRAGRGGSSAGGGMVEGADDVETAAALAHHLDAGAGPPLAASFRDPALRRAIGRRLRADGQDGRVVLVDRAADLVRAVVARERLFAQAHWRDQDRVHAVIVGFGALGRACMAEGVMAGIAGDLAPPRLTILDPRPERVRAALDADMPEIGASADVVVGSFDASRPHGSVMAGITGAAPVTAVFLCLADEAQQAAALLAVEAVQAECGAPAPVFALSEARAPLVELVCPPGRPGHLAHRFAVLHAGDVAADNRDAGIDGIARRLHGAYLAAFGAEEAARGTASAVAWDRLPEDYRAANRRAARHLPQKLWTLGITWPGRSPDGGAVVSEVFDGVVVPCARATGEDAPTRRLARLEHARWCADRRLAGWRHGTSRDEARRRHPDLIAFDDPRLSDREIAKDVQQIRTLLATAVRPCPNGASAPVVVGILGSADAAPGIGLTDALAVLDAARWRPVIVLAAAAGGGEAETVDALLAPLRASGRPFRSLILSRGRADAARGDGGGPRAASSRPSALAREASILQLAGPPDGWVDSDRDERWIEDYFERRATIVVRAPS